MIALMSIRVWVGAVVSAFACAAAPVDPPVAPNAGRALFLASCATCHLGQGGLIGQAGPPDLLRGPLPRGDSEGALTAWTANGTGSPAMPAFAGGLSAAEIAEVVRYIRAERALKR